MRYLLLLLGIPIALIVGMSFYLQPNSYIGCGETPALSSNECQTADAIVVVSGGDTGARTDEGIKLYQNGWADLLVMSGAAQDKTGPSNAAVMRQQAIESGVPASVIRIDEYSETTEENAVNSQTIFTNEGIASVILVTSGYHQQRASLEFKKSNEQVTVLNHPLLNDRNWSQLWWMTPTGWWLATGELMRIMVFYGQGLFR
jgi:uncharacterized SAM-binding protein YcdF (DUF218 family)